jgi:membrane protein
MTDGAPTFLEIDRAASVEHEAKTWTAILRRVQKKMVRDRVSLSAGSLAYHWFLALFPAIVAVIGLLTIIHLRAVTIDRVTHGIDVALPSGVSDVFNTAVRTAAKRSSSSAAAVIVGFAVALWSASSGMAALEQALDIAYEVPTDRTFLVRRARAVPLMVATAILGGAGAALIVFGQPLGAAIEGHVPLHGAAFTVIWTVVRWVVTAVAVTTLFSVFYAFGPNRPTFRWRWISAGGVLATVVFLAASLGFSFYVAKFGSYGKTYGSFAGVAILIFWLYLTGLAVLIGGEINAELERESSPTTSGSDEFEVTMAPGGNRKSPSGADAE